MNTAVRSPVAQALLLSAARVVLRLSPIGHLVLSRRSSIEALHRANETRVGRLNPP